MVEFDRSAFIATFREEAAEHLQRLNEGVIALETDPHDRDLVEQMLRDAHTLKGSGRMVGLIEVSDVAHRLEDVMVLIRDGRLGFSADMSDVFFEALDTIVHLADRAGEPAGPDVDSTGVCGRLAALTTGGGRGAEAASAPGSHAGIGTAEAPTADDAGLDALEYDAGLSALEAASEATRDEETLKVAEMTTFRVRTGQVDTLLNTVSEAVIAQIKQEERAGRLKALAARTRASSHAWAAVRDQVERLVTMEAEASSSLASALAAFEQQFVSQGSELVELAKGHGDDLARSSTVIGELQERAMELRMLPVSTIFAAYPRAVRDLARDAGKQIELVMEGGHTRLDKKVLEEIADPLVHLMRNAVDHGIEPPEVRLAAGKPAQGTVRLAARQEGDHIIIEVADDGAGIDPDRIRATAVRRGYLLEAEARAMPDDQARYLVFESGFTTSPIITEISGRGVGLDVVRRFIVERLKGSLDVESVIGGGTTFRVRIPLTLAIIRALLLRASGRTFALPTASVEETLSVASGEVECLEGREVIRGKRGVVPLVHLADVLGLDVPDRPERLHIAIVGQSSVSIGFVVDAFDGEQQVVLKTLGSHLRYVDNIAGATILGAGDIVPILDVPRLVANARSKASSHVRLSATDSARRRRVLICEDSFTTRELERSIFEAAGYEVEVATDGAAGLGRLQCGADVDAVVTDVQMPNMDGFELSRAIKADERLQRLPVVIVTSLEREEEKLAGIEAGADAYITKSVFNQDTLLETVERLIR